ncbi:hypothetical protein FPZ43_11475 [Mucilaginibacter pallidiroseus]|uniref:Uncharacterized protein n=1 Tax=Mucilaginibacter pallidiroseus TaxID=2599295 RepID=A0A563UC19_9SPHI|nr:hypothetical protein [Mucilaginibacter pallidiroseus]TWR28884.1 hypothetical protein FPZ43_11475 [Mucilaginibacter pallidiroseus]
MDKRLRRSEKAYPNQTWLFYVMMLELFEIADPMNHKSIEPTGLLESLIIARLRSFSSFLNLTISKLLIKGYDKPYNCLKVNSF